jgi:hypothetical protein
MLESKIEEHLRKKVKDVLQGIAYKFTSPSRRSVPDRLCLLPGGKAIFVELKAPGKKPTEGQLREHKRLRALGFQVDVIDSKEGVDEWVKNNTTK